MDASALPPLAGEDHVCPSCELSYRAMDRDEACAVLQQAPDRVRALADAAPPHRWRVHPDAQTWSAVEYLCHLRDVIMTYTIRLHRVRVEDGPVLEPMLNDLRAQRFRYRDHDVGATLAEFALLVPGVLEEARRFGDADWERVATRSTGESRTARWMLRQAAHECLHHVEDIAAALRAD